MIRLVTQKDIDENPDFKGRGISVNQHYNFPDKPANGGKQKEVPPKAATRRQKNNHARTKRRVQVLHLKMFFRRVMDLRHKKIMQGHKTPGVTVIGEAKNYATYVNYDPFEHRPLIATKLRGRLNQKQKRRLWRQAPHMRIKRA